MVVIGGDGSFQELTPNSSWFPCVGFWTIDNIPGTDDGFDTALKR